MDRHVAHPLQPGGCSRIVGQRGDSPVSPRACRACKIAAPLHRRLETSVIRLARIAALAALCSVTLTAVHAADYPVRPVKWVVPYPPAGTTDVLARIVAQWLTEKLGQPF